MPGASLPETEDERALDDEAYARSHAHHPPPPPPPPPPPSPLSAWNGRSCETARTDDSEATIQLPALGRGSCKISLREPDTRRRSSLAWSPKVMAQPGQARGRRRLVDDGGHLAFSKAVSEKESRPGPKAATLSFSPGPGRTWGPTSFSRRFFPLIRHRQRDPAGVDRSV